MAYSGHYCVYKCETDRMNEKKNIGFYTDEQFAFIVHKIVDEGYDLTDSILSKLSDNDLMELSRYRTERELYLQRNGVIYD